MSDTSSPEAAREHARAQASKLAANVRSQPRIPVSEATDLPDDLRRGDLFWDETLDAGAYSSRVLERGSRLRLIDLAGDACAAVLLYNADHPAERINVADTVKVQWQAYLGEGSLLLSDMGRVMCSIVRDDSGCHDAFCGCSSAASNSRKYGSGVNHGDHPNARDRFMLALAKFGLGRRDIPTNVNFFKSVRVGPEGHLEFRGGADLHGAVLELRAEMRCLVVVTNTPHVLDPRPKYTAGPLRLLGTRGPIAEENDEVRNSSPERARAFLNVEDYYAR